MDSPPIPLTVPPPVPITPTAPVPGPRCRRLASPSSTCEQVDQVFVEGAERVGGSCGQFWRELECAGALEVFGSEADVEHVFEHVWMIGQPA